MLFGTTIFLAQGLQYRHAASYSIVTETGNDNSANIMQTDMCQKLPKMAIIMVSVGTKRSVCYSVW
jgi:hypothetical protein